MTAALEAGPTEQTRRARIAVAALFLTNGALFSNVVPRYPEIKEALDLSNTLFGTAVAAGPLGALTGGLFAAAAIRRFRSSRTGAVGIVLIAVAFLLVAAAPTWWLLGLVLFLAGSADAIVDVAQNAHGLRVQRRYGRSIVNSLHGLWSVGAALAGFALAGLGTATLVPAAMHTADELPGLPHGAGLTIVSWLLRVGFLLSPPLVGLVADLTSLRVGLLSVVVAGVGTLLLGRVLLNRR